MKTIFAAASTLALSLSAAQAGTVTSTFDTDGEGFTLSGGALSFAATGGNPGGHIRATDTVSTFMQLTLPSKFTAAPLLEGGTISFDAREFGSGPSVSGFGTITLSDGTNTATRDPFGSTLPAGVWTSISADLDAGDWSLSGGTFETILANISSISIQVESINGFDEVVGIDNVSVDTVSPVPLPMTAPLLIAGVLGLGYATRRGRR